jgi:hypothetical protein
MSYQVEFDREAIRGDWRNPGHSDRIDSTECSKEVHDV